MTPTGQGHDFNIFGPIISTTAGDIHTWLQWSTYSLIITPAVNGVLTHRKQQK